MGFIGLESQVAKKRIVSEEYCQACPAYRNKQCNTGNAHKRISGGKCNNFEENYRIPLDKKAKT